MSDGPSYLKPLESQLALSNIGFGTMFTDGSNTKPVTAPTTAVTTVATSAKIHFMLVSTHLQQFTGYSKVSHNLVLELSKQPWVRLVHYGFQKNPQSPPNYRGYPSNVDVIDAAGLEAQQQGQGQQGFGFSQLPEVIRRKDPDVVMIYNDMSVVARFLEEIRKSGIPRTFKIWIYVDQVYTTQLQMYLDVLNRDADRIFAFTPYWKQCLKDQGITRPIDILLHGFDNKTFTPVSKEMIRKQMNLPQDAFIYLSLNRNQPRKRYDILIRAFVELVVKYPTKPVFLLCICDKGEKGGWWLFEIFQRELKLRNVKIEQFGNRLMLSNQDMSFRDEDINMFYNATDVGVSSADGEGFGLCHFEQMGVGVPQVVPDIGGFKEFCNTENTVLVKPTERYYMPTAFSPVGGECHAVTPHDLCLGMEEYLLNSDKREAHGKAAREKVLTYTWERAAAPLLKQLKRALEDMEEAA